jgi:hypothetical protein
MERTKYIKYSDYLTSGLFTAGAFVFFAFFYNNHLHFEEQFQLFLLTGDFFLGKIKVPGGFTGYAGGFLTQFYYLNMLGPAIISIILLLFQQIIKRVLQRMNPDKSLFPVSFIPPLIAVFILFSEFYMLSAILGTLLSVIGGWIYIRIINEKRRFLAGLIFILSLYWLAGGAYVCLVLLMLTFEFLDSLRSGAGFRDLIDKKGKFLVSFLLLAAVLPVITGYLLILKPGLTSVVGEFYYKKLAVAPVAIFILFLVIPILMVLTSKLSFREGRFKIVLVSQLTLLLILSFAGIRLFANFRAEEVMTYDYLVRESRWNEVINYAERRPPRNYLSLSMLNLSLAKAGKMGDKMFSYNQHGINGLFLSFNKEYVAPLLGNEIFYQLGLINASQEYAFESMETIPNMDKSVRILKRLAETNLINGQYGVAEKYLGLLQKTLFYRKWAKETMEYLGDEEKINNNPEWGDKRKFAVLGDYFFDVGSIETSLKRMVKEHPDNRIALEYLMAFYLMRKDLDNFTNLIPLMEKIGYKTIPASYQEAILYVIGMNGGDPFTGAPGYISQGTRSKMKAYIDIFSTYADAGERLKRNFGATYWYFLNFNEEGIN